MYKSLSRADNLIIIGLWVAWFLLLFWVSSTVGDLKPFDPFEILEIDRGATDKEIKKAYRQLSLRFHPDKNPDPKARITPTCHTCTLLPSAFAWTLYMGHCSCLC